MNFELITGALHSIIEMLVQNTILTSPLTFAALMALAVLLVWAALAPSPSSQDEETRLEGYLRGGDIIEETDMERSFVTRAVVPFVRKILGALAALSPQKNVDRMQTLLIHAGEPAGMAPFDVMGLQILLALGLALLYLLVLRLMGQIATMAPLTIARNALVLVLVGFLAPTFWLRHRANQRKREIIRSFSDALDLLSVSVDAGLAFDSALLRVCEQWENALTHAFNRALLEMRVGTPREVALERMAERTGVQDVETFVGVLIQSSELGVSIAHTLHTQAAQVRLRRRQRAEELAQQAAVKMVFPLVFLVFPALLIVLLGPGLPRIFQALGSLGQ